MRDVRWSAAFAALFACTGCALVHHLDEFTVGSSSSGGGSDVDPAVAPTSTDARADGGAECRVSSDCGPGATGAAFASLDRESASAPRVCVSGRCEALLSEDCPRVLGDALADDAVIVGGIFDPASEDDVRAARIALDEIAQANAAPEARGRTNLARSAHERPLALLACTANGRERQAAEHLVRDLRVPAVIGPAAAEAVIELTQQITVPADTLLVTPSVASPISSLADNDLTWRAVPSDAQRAKLVIDQVNALESVLRSTRGTTSVRFAVVHTTDTLGTSAFDSIRGKLIVNSRFLTDPSNAANVSDDTYAPGDVDGMAAIATRYGSTFRPDIVYITAAEQIANVMVPLERALTAGRVVDKPFYVLAEPCRSDELLDAVATSLPADIRRRMRGVGVQAEAPSAPVLQAFESAWASRHGGRPSLRAAAVYDTTYALAFALAAAREDAPTGASLGRGLRRLGVGEPVAVGPEGARAALSTLAAGGSVAPRGTTAKLAWDPAGDPASGTLAVWCVGGTAQAPAFGPAGVSMDVATQVVGGAFVQCQ